jgi:hypothetical protein
MQKTPKNHTAVIITVSRRYPLFYMVVSQNSPLIILRLVKSCRYLFSNQSFEIAASQMHFERLPLTLKIQTGKKTS